MKVIITPREHVWRDVTDEQLAAIRDAGATEVVVATDRETELREIRDADALIGVIDPELLERAGQLRWVSALSAGVDAMLFPEFVESDIVLTSEKGLVGPHLADHAFALLLSLTRSISWAARQRRWDNRLEMRRASCELTDKTMGIIGFGGTGVSVAERAVAFGMRCLAIDPDVTENPGTVEVIWKPDQLIEMARQADVIAVCCPWTPETDGMVDRNVLFAMPVGGYVVNVTRGGIIDEAALVEAIRSGQLAGAGLDVTAEEPLPDDSPLWKYDNIVISPHTAGASQFRAGRGHARIVRNVANLVNDRPLEGVIDKRKGY